MGSWTSNETAAKHSAKLRASRLVQACRCGEVIVATRYAFGEKAAEHFKGCKAAKIADLPAVQARWYNWVPVDPSWVMAPDPFADVMSTYAFEAPLFVYADGKVLQARMIESVIADIRSALCGPVPSHSVPVLHAALLRLIEHPRSQDSVRVVLGLADTEPGAERLEATLDVLRRAALGSYG
jgi:hypothetical protein